MARMWIHDYSGRAWLSGWPHPHTQPEDEGTGSQQHVADVPEVGVKVIEQRLPCTADEAAVQAACLGAEQLEGLCSATPLGALQTDWVSEQPQWAPSCSSARLALPHKNWVLWPGPPHWDCWPGATEGAPGDAVPVAHDGRASRRAPPAFAPLPWSVGHLSWT